MSASAFKGSYADWKLIKTRGVVQVVVEIPLADADAAYAVLGGMPDPGHERWVAVAALQSAEAQPRQIESKRTAGAKRDWKELQPQQQAGIRCGEPSFVAFLRERHTDSWRESEDAAECVRLICGVHSRVELGTNHKAHVMWKQLDDQYQAWKQVEHA